MKRLLLLLILFCCAQFQIVAQEIEPRSATTITLQSEPSGAEVFFGDSLIGETPLRIFKRDVASVRVYYPSRNDWNAEMCTVPTHPIGSDEGIILLHFKAQPRIYSTPYGAAVFHGDTVLGYTPLVWPDSLMNDTLRVEAPGYNSVLIEQSLAEAGRIHLLLEQNEVTAMMKKVDVRSSEIVLPSARILFPAGIGLVAGIASVIWKQRADNVYGEYRNSGNRDLLVKTRHYDFYAGLALAVLQASIGYFVYLLFKEM